MKFQATVDGELLTFEIRRKGERITVARDGVTDELDIVRLTPHSYSVLMGGKSHYVTMMELPTGFKVVIDQEAYEIQIKDETELLLEQYGIGESLPDTHGQVRAPIPGLVSSILVEPGQKIRKGEKCVILEAMKMENEIDSPISGTVEKVAVSQGQTVEKGALLISILTDSHGNR